MSEETDEKKKIYSQDELAFTAEDAAEHFEALEAVLDRDLRNIIDRILADLARNWLIEF